jgi:hypothetical protein
MLKWGVMSSRCDTGKLDFSNKYAEIREGLHEGNDNGAEWEPKVNELWDDLKNLKSTHYFMEKE